MKDIDKRNVEDFLKEGNAKQLLEFLIQSNKNLMPEEAKILQQRAAFAVPLRRKDGGLPCEWHVDASNQRNSSNSGGACWLPARPIDQS